MDAKADLKALKDRYEAMQYNHKLFYSDAGPLIRDLIRFAGDLVDEMEKRKESRPARF